MGGYWKLLMLKLIEGHRAEQETELAKDLFRPTAEQSPRADALLRDLASRGSLAVVSPMPSQDEPELPCLAGAFDAERNGDSRTDQDASA